MIDKLDVRIPEGAPPGPILKGFMEDLKSHPELLVRPSKYYKYAWDLREVFGIDAVIHLWCKFGKPNHKVEIIDAGDYTLEEMTGTICQLFEVDPWGLEVMRVDLAADIAGVPVPWFREHAYISRKRYSSRIEKSFEHELEFVAMANGLAQTIYAGKRPNIFRIYDKQAELRMQWRRIVMRYGKINKQTEGYFDKLVPPTFEEFCRTKFYQFEPGKILTRIERQIGGKIPTEYATVGDLRRVHETLPFTALRIMPGSKVEAFGPPREGIAIRNHLAALGFEALKEQLGSLQIARQFVFKNANGNGQRVLDSLAESLPRSLQGVTLDQIHASFRASSAPQTSRKPEGVICFSPTSELDEFLQTFPSSDGGVDSSPTYDLSI